LPSRHAGHLVHGLPLRHSRIASPVLSVESLTEEPVCSCRNQLEILQRFCSPHILHSQSTRLGIKKTVQGNARMVFMAALRCGKEGRISVPDPVFTLA
jgi:hypothetical protein